MDFELNTKERTLTIGGQDVSEHVQAIDVYMENDSPPEVQVWVKDPGTITGEGVVVVHEPPDEETLTAAIRTFLESLDPKQVQEAANTLPAVWSTPPAENVIKAILGAL